jgi:hypothetical protein
MASHKRGPELVTRNRALLQNISRDRLPDEAVVTIRRDGQLVPNDGAYPPTGLR